MAMHQPRETLSRRRMLREAAVAGGLGAIFQFTGRSAAGQPPPRSVQYGPINKYSAPSDLKITDMRAVTVASNFDFNIIRVDTNQGVYGLGEVRDGGSKGTALMLKPLLVGRNPLDITAILKAIRPYSGHGRQGGGYSAVDLALHDLVGKVFGVPVWRLLGDKKMSRVRMYCDTTGIPDPKKYAERMKKRKDMGFTWFKMDIRYGTIGDAPGAFNDYGILTDKGLAIAGELVTAVKEAVGWTAPLGVETSSGMKPVPGSPYPKLPVKDAIRIARYYEKFDLAWIEDLFNAGGFWDWKGYKQIHDATTTKILTGEDAFGLEEGFKPLIDNHAVDIVQPDPGTSGQCRETKRIADYAAEHGIDVAIHMAGSPIGCMGAAHTACTMENFLAMECHAVDFMSWWQELVAGVPKPFIKDGYITVPDSPGIGLELNEPVVKEHLRLPGYFEPTPQYDNWQPRTRGAFPHFNPEGQWVTEGESYTQ